VHTRSGRWLRAGEKRDRIESGCTRGKRAPVVWARQSWRQRRPARLEDALKFISRRLKSRGGRIERGWTYPERATKCATYSTGEHVAVCLHLLAQVACSDSEGSLCLATSHPSSASRPRPHTPTPTFFCVSFSPTPIRPHRLPRAERAGCSMMDERSPISRSPGTRRRRPESRTSRA
jgi:hypothetical protein